MKRCLQCLIPSGVSILHETYVVPEDTPEAEKVSLKDNRCQFCRSFNQHFDPAYLREEVNAFVQTEEPVLVALSGGKNSLATLVLAKEMLGLNISALTIDNGFIPAPTIKFAEKTCKKLKIPWKCVKSPLHKEFLDEYQPDENGAWKAQTGLDFCSLNAQHIQRHIREWAVNHNLHRVIMGNRTHTHMNPRVSCLDMQDFEQGEQVFSLCNIHLLFGLSVNNTRQNRILNELDWKDPEKDGFSSSSLIPGFVDQARRHKLGFGIDTTGYLEKELRCGAHTLQEAQEIIKHTENPDISAEITKFFKDKKLL